MKPARGMAGFFWVTKTKRVPGGLPPAKDGGRPRPCTRGAEHPLCTLIISEGLAWRNPGGSFFGREVMSSDVHRIYPRTTIIKRREEVKRKVLASLLVIAVVTGLVGASTWAYFSDTETSDNTFTAGTLDLVLKDGDEDWANGVTNTWSSPNWAPGDPEVVAELRMKNIGTTGAAMVRVCGENLTEGGPASPDDIANHIHLTTIQYTENGTYLYGNLAETYADWFGAAGTYLTLREFVDTEYCMAFWIGDCTGWPECNPAEDYLPANGARLEYLKLGFTFESGAGNEYQGDWASFDVVVKADDDTSLLGKGGGCHGY